MKTFIILNIIVFYSTSINGQSISSYTIASAGSTLLKSEASLRFTAGELAVGKYKSTNPGGYQGFVLPQSLVVTSIIDYLLREVKLWPNPTNGLINILTDNTNVKNITIYDQQGRLVKELKYNQEIDLTKHSNGLYVMKLFDDKNLVIKSIKILKK